MTRHTAASAGTLLLTAGAAGKRFALPHATIRIHEPLGGVQGQATEIDMHARVMLRLREVCNAIFVRHTGQPKPKVAEETARDRFLTPDEAKTDGLIDEVMVSRHGKRAVTSPAKGCAAQSNTTQAYAHRAQVRGRGSIHAAERRPGGRAALLVLWQIAGGRQKAYCRTDGLHLR